MIFVEIKENKYSFSVAVLKYANHEQPRQPAINN